MSAEAPALIGTSGDSLREAFGKALSALADEFPKLVVLDADIAGGTGVHHFRKSHPERLLQFGIAEQNMMAAAGGLAAVGLHAGRHHLRRVLPARHRTGAAFARLCPAQRQDRGQPSRPRCRPRWRLGPGAGRPGRVPRHSRHDGDLARRSDRNGAGDARDPGIRRPGLYAHRPQPRQARCSATTTHSKSARARSCATAATSPSSPAASKWRARWKRPSMLAADGIGARVVNMATIKPIDTRSAGALRRGNRRHRHGGRSQHPWRPGRRGGGSAGAPRALPDRIRRREGRVRRLRRAGRTGRNISASPRRFIAEAARARASRARRQSMMSASRLPARTPSSPAAAAASAAPSRSAWRKPAPMSCSPIARSRDEAEAVVRQIEELGRRALALQMDVTDRASVEAAANDARALRPDLDPGQQCRHQQADRFRPGDRRRLGHDPRHQSQRPVHLRAGLPAAAGDRPAAAASSISVRSAANMAARARRIMPPRRPG